VRAGNDRSERQRHATHAVVGVCKVAVHEYDGQMRDAQLLRRQGAQVQLRQLGGGPFLQQGGAGRSWEELGGAANKYGRSMNRGAEQQTAKEIWDVCDAERDSGRQRCRGTSEEAQLPRTGLIVCPLTLDLIAETECEGGDLPAAPAAPGMAPAPAPAAAAET
jgi:hypothetical protein